MSHFSKIKTNINNLDTLTKTLNQLGFKSQLIDNNSHEHLFSGSSSRSLVVYEQKDYNNNNPICTFAWNKSEYSVVVDLHLWSLGMDFQHFIEILSQKYAYNMIISRSSLNGFQMMSEYVRDDGSISLTLRRWSAS